MFCLDLVILLAFFSQRACASGIIELLVTCLRVSGTGCIWMVGQYHHSLDDYIMWLNIKSVRQLKSKILPHTKRSGTRRNYPSLVYKLMKQLFTSKIWRSRFVDKVFMPLRSYGLPLDFIKPLRYEIFIFYTCLYPTII